MFVSRLTSIDNNRNLEVNIALFTPLYVFFYNFNDLLLC